jgi:Raf kinase inhibitor-like YbhB/YbcL family protein
MNAGSSTATTKPGAKMKISSSAFADHQAIPAQYTCDGPGLIPPLQFADTPAGAKSLALVVDDPDAPGGTWDHWVVWNIPPATISIAEGQQPPGTHGRNSWGKNQWGGPCPPDRQHRYFFKVYALDTMLKLDESATRKELEKAMNGHVLASGELVGTYKRKK